MKQPHYCILHLTENLSEVVDQFTFRVAFDKDVYLTISSLQSHNKINLKF